MSTILFVFSAATYYREVAPVVERFARNGWQTVVLFGSRGRITEQASEECRRIGCRVILAPVEVSYGSADGKRPTARERSTGSSVALEHPTTKGYSSASRRKRRIPGMVRPLGRILSGAHHWKRIGAVRRYGEDLVREIAPDAVVQGAYHSCGHLDNAIGRACRLRGLPMFCIPSSPYLGECTLKVARLNHLLTGMCGPYIRADYDWMNRVLAMMLPSWTRVLADGTRVFFWDPVYMLVAWARGLMMRRMWTKPSIDFTRVFLFSDYSRELLRADGYPMEKVLVSGQPLLDPVWERVNDEAHRERIYQDVELLYRSPFILCNVEPCAEHAYCSWERHWELFDSTMRAVIAPGIPVVLSLHPLCDAKEYAFAERKYGVKICTRFKIHDLYPYCIVSVSFPCSTNLLAEEFGKPLVIYDYFGLTDRDRDSARLNKIEHAIVAMDSDSLKRGVVLALRDRGKGSCLPPRVRPSAVEVIFSIICGTVARGPGTVARGPAAERGTM